MKDFRDIKAWNKAHELALKVYRKSEKFPVEERYGLTSQIRRAAVSIPTNIAEGCGRGSDADFDRLVQIALGSASEVEYLLLLSRDLKLFRSEDYQTSRQCRRG
jgi:four helix bundle protein